MVLDSNNTTAIVIEGGVSAAIAVFMQQTVMQTIPWLVCVTPLLIIDGIVGVRAAKYRYEKTHKDEDKFRFSKLLRKSIGKVFEYVSWCILGAALSVAVNKGWVSWVVLFLPFINELASIWGHKLELQGVELNLTNLWRLIFRKGAEKAGVEVEKTEVETIIRERDNKGRFIKRKEQ